jgi:hypothetical protein
VTGKGDEPFTSTLIRIEGTMIRSHLSLLTLAATVLLGCQQALAQEKPAQPKLAIEILDGRKRPPAPVFEPPSEGGMEMGTTDPIPDFKQTGAPLTRLRIRMVLEGDAVRIKIAGVFDDSEPVDAPGPKYGPVEKPIGSYLAREGETIKVNELTSLGFKPLALKVVRFVPEVETPVAAFVPLVTNNLKSVEVVDLSPVAGISSYRLTVRNISSKNIVALDVYVPKERGRSGVTSMGNATRPLMKPGATSETLISEGRGRRLTDQGYVAEEPSNKVIVGTVVFDDETYEGEPETALHVVGGQTGHRLQLTRALFLLKNILEGPDQDPASMLGRTRSEVSQLTIDVDSKIVDELLARFPELPTKYDRKTLASTLMRGFLDARQRLLSEISDIENATRRDPTSVSLVWQRLSSFKEQLETELQAARQATSRRVGAGP